MMSHYKTGEEIEVNLIDNKNQKVISSLIALL